MGLYMGCTGVVIGSLANVQNYIRRDRPTGVTMASNGGAGQVRPGGVLYNVDH